jgi:hypothetical protein
MPQLDDVPRPRDFLVQRLSRISRLLALLAIAIAGVAVFLAGRGEESGAIHLMIGTALAVGLAVLLGLALMTLVLLRSPSARNERPRRKSPRKAMRQ